MRNIVIGCPYSALRDLHDVLIKTSSDEFNIIDVNDISCIDSDFLFLKNGYKISFTDVNASYIRYPYDLISPHTQTYQKREQTEFLKTVALMLDNVSLNKIRSAHFARNRVYSLKKAKDLRLETPKACVVREKSNPLSKKKLITKSLGNCFFSDKNTNSKNELLASVLSYEKDGKDHAYIYSPHLIKEKDVEKYVTEFGTCYIQEYLDGKEFRVFLVGSEAFIYEREDIGSVDKSSAGLASIDSNIIKSQIHKLKHLQRDLCLQYLCMDIIVCNQKLYVIDINPYGSFPQYSRNPEVVNAVANLLLRYE